MISFSKFIPRIAVEPLSNDPFSYRFGIFPPIGSRYFNYIIFT
jgi:hypothetical protein